LSLSKWRIRLQQHVSCSILSEESTEVVDCGCGIGYGVALASGSRGRFVVGVDASGIALQHAKNRVAQMGVQNATSLIRCDVASLPFRPDSFDAAFCVLVIDAFQSIEHVLDEISGVVKHGGQLIIADLDPATLSMATVGKVVQYLDKRSGHPYTLHPAAEVGGALSQLGFAPITKQRRHFGISPPIYVVAAKKT